MRFRVMVLHGASRVMTRYLWLNPQTATLYSNRYRQLSHDSDPDYNELGRCTSDNSFWYSNGYNALPFFIIKPNLKIEDCHTGTNECSFYLHNAGKRTAKGVRIKFRVKQKLPRRPKPPKLLHKFSTLNLEPFDIDPDETISVKICELSKDQRAIFQLVQDDQVFKMPSLSLEKGRKYELLFKFVGRNYSDRKLWPLLLDITHEKPKFDLIPRNVFTQYLSNYLRNRG